MATGKEFQQSFGKGMITLAWLVLLGLLTLFFSGYLEHQSAPNASLSQSADRQVVLKMNRAGHYVAPGWINGKSVKFLLDTGATDVAVPASLARQLSLPRGADTLSQTANGVVRSYRTVLDSVRLGGIELNNIRATVFPGMPGGEVLLGMSFLKHLELTQREKTLVLSL